MIIEIYYLRKYFYGVWIMLKGTSVLVIAAHPDDADFYCGGTIARWIEEGSNVNYVICTDGALGSEDGRISSDELIELRKREQKAANQIMGVLETVYLNHPDMGLLGGELLRKELAREIRRFKPQILMTFDPWLKYELHPDHTVAGFETIYARLAARMPLKYRDLENDGYPAWQGISEIYLFKTDNPNTWVETEDHLRVKIEVLKCHKSQFGHMIQDESQAEYLLREMSHKHPETGRISEGFKVIKLEGIEGLKSYIRL